MSITKHHDCASHNTTQHKLSIQQFNATDHLTATNKNIQHS